MRILSNVKRFLAMLSYFARKPELSHSFFLRSLVTLRGERFSQKWQSVPHQENLSHPKGNPLMRELNPLTEFFNSHTEGKGVWKWMHYFDIYHHHFKKFVGQEVCIVEVGIYSGGSLEMWKSYFGPKCRIYGIDIEEACRVYEDENVKIFIGDQADREFWRKFKSEVPKIDILIDDGGHYPEQQIITLEEMLPHLRPNGVYLCEDVHGISNDYTAYIYGLIDNLNFSPSRELPDGQLVVIPNGLQRAVHSIHSYPFVTVIERSDGSLNELVAPKHGTQWQPFYEREEKDSGEGDK